ncbi:MAG: hypothetical protein U9O98_05075 [Asgard group archaeon]|nr:hypothetical protein [Asgard group archaeon]
MVSLKPATDKLQTKGKLQKSQTQSFCSDCVYTWCANRGKVAYCSQKYKGTKCYTRKTDYSNLKRIAGY